MAEDEPRRGEVPEHGQDPDTATPAADQPSTEPAPSGDPATGPSADRRVARKVLSRRPGRSGRADDRRAVARAVAGRADAEPRRRTRPRPGSEPLGRRDRRTPGGRPERHDGHAGRAAPRPAGAETGRPVWSARAQVPQAESDDTAADGEGYDEEPPGARPGRAGAGRARRGRSCWSRSASAPGWSSAVCRATRLPRRSGRRARPRPRRRRPPRSPHPRRPSRPRHRPRFRCPICAGRTTRRPRTP